MQEVKLCIAASKYAINEILCALENSDLFTSRGNCYSRQDQIIFIYGNRTVMKTNCTFNHHTE